MLFMLAIILFSTTHTHYIMINRVYKTQVVYIALRYFNVTLKINLWYNYRKRYLFYLFIDNFEFSKRSELSLYISLHDDS